MTKLLISIIFIALAGCAGSTRPQPPASPARSQYGGCLDVRGDKTGFFHTQQIAGRWWLVDPDGYGYLGFGMADLGSYGGGRGNPATNPVLVAKYGNRDAWRDAQIGRLLSWGFNFSQPDNMANDPVFRGTTKPSGPWMPYTFILPAGGRSTEALRDVFDDSFTQGVRAMAAQRCAPLKDNPRLVGYCTGNELGWNIAWGGSHIENYIGLPPGSGGRKAAAEFLAKRYVTVEQFNKVWDTSLKGLDELAAGTVKAGPRYDRVRMAADRDDFTFLVSRQFFGTLYREIKAVDPNHMVIGSRFLTGDVSMSVARGMKGNVDVVTSNCYLVHRWPKFFDDLHRETGVPIFITEFGYRAKDNGLPADETGAIPRVLQTDQDRAEHYEWYLRHLETVPYLVGTNWWWYPDGFGGAPANFGFVSAKDEPYPTLVAAAKRTNFSIYAGALAGKKLVQDPPVEYAIAKCPPMKLDGSADKYGRFDIQMDHRNAYEGYDFAKSGLAAEATVRHDGQNVYLAIRVKDGDVKLYEVSKINALIPPPAPPSTTRATRPATGPRREQPISPWTIDGVEFWLGHYQGVLYFDGETAKADVPSGAIPDMEVAGRLVDGGYFFEIKVPTQWIADAIKDGQIQLAIGVNDGHRAGRMRQIYWPLTYEWMYQDTFATGRLGK